MHRLSRTVPARNRVAAYIFMVCAVYFLFTCFPEAPSLDLDPLPGSLEDLEPAYDYVVVGGGQSGLVVANRLSEDRKYTVLIVEPGPYLPDHEAVTRPWRPFNLSMSQFQPPFLMFNTTTVPQEALRWRRTKLEAGYGAGGGSTVNGMLFNRGAAADYDAWEELGNPGWGWSGILPYFKKSVTFTPPSKWMQQKHNVTWNETAYGVSGGNGPIHASYPDWVWPGQKLQADGWAELGIKRTEEGAGGDATGIFWVPRAQNPQSQTRSYSVSGHLKSALERGNVQLLSGFSVKKVLLSAKNVAEGVVIEETGQDETKLLSTTVSARKEVILAANFHSPVVLQRSGIGPRKVLEDAGIEVKLDLPGVGSNFQDHPVVGVAFSYDKDLNLSPANMAPGSAADLMAEVLYNSTLSGPYIGGHNQVAFLAGHDFLSPEALRSSINSQAPLQYLPLRYGSEPSLLAGFMAQRRLILRAISARNSTLLETPIAGDAYSLLILQKPLSRGTITLNATHPFGPPVIDPQTLVNPADVSTFVSAIRIARKQQNSKAMAPLLPKENSPGQDVTSEGELGKYLRSNAGSSIGHESGGCAMMPLELGGVVDPQLRVYGVKRLRVVDSSVIPLVPSTNLCATVYAVAERAADIIRGKRLLIEENTENVGRKVRWS